MGVSHSFSFTCGHVNVNSLPNKLNEIFLMLSSHSIDLLGISETWLTEDTPSSFVGLPGFDLVRADSPGNVRKHGVAVYISSSIKFVRIDCSVSNVVVVYICSLDLYVLTVYRPPSFSVEDNAALIDFIVEFCLDKEVIVQGDFNLPSLRWDNDDVLGAYVTPVDLIFYNAFCSAGLAQVVEEPTNFPSCSVIDLCFLSYVERFGSCVVLPPLSRCSHGAVLVTYVFQDHDSMSGASDSLAVRRIWSKGRYDLMRKPLIDVDWHFDLMYLTPSDQYTIFLAVLGPLIDRYVPLRGFAEGDRVPWSTNPGRALMQRKRAAWSSYKEARASNGRRSPQATAAWSNFQSVARDVKMFSYNSQKTYERGVVSQINDNPKLFHSYLKHRKVGKPTVGPIMLPSGSLSDDAEVMANCFVESFASVFASDPAPNILPHQMCPSNSSCLEVHPTSVEEVLSALDPNSSMGSDGVHPRLLKTLSLELSLPLSIIFNSSLSWGSLPCEWLVSFVVPIYKSGGRYNPLNYRPISLTSVPCKVMERLMVRLMMDYLDSNSLLSAHQFGFRSKHSTIDQLLLTYDYISAAVDSGKVVDLLFFDFSKAFDRVSHSVLLDKLVCIGVHSSLIAWIGEFLRGRSMYVGVAGRSSRRLPVTSGVPQGSVLGPVLFLIYINHVVAGLTCQYKLFADDIKLYLSFDITDLEAGISSGQRNIDLLINTSEAWGLSMNVAKCVCVRFSRRRHNMPSEQMSPYTIGGNPIRFVSSHRDLGVLVDGDLKFHSHISTVSRFANALTSNILSCTLCRDADFILNIYTMHIRPLLEYGCCLWNTGYLGDLRLLERVQRRWTRSVDGLQDVPYAERLRALDLFSVKGRLLRADLILTYMIFSDLCAVKPSDLFTVLSNSITRGHQFKVAVPRTSLDSRKRFFAVRVVPWWNSLAGDTVAADSVGSFKRLLQRDLGEVLYEYHD